jgi:hypothetical protein
MVWAAGCGSGGGGNDGSGGSAGSNGGTCSEQPTFPARGYGDDNTDLIRQIRIDDATGDMYFTTYSDLYVLRSGASEPAAISHLGGAFWLTDDAFLFPNGFAIDDPIVVLHSVPRTGGDATAAITSPASTSRNDVFNLGDSALIGDQLVWITSSFHTSNPDRLPRVYDSKKWEVRKTSMKSPAAAQTLYTSSRELSTIVADRTNIYVEEETGAEQSRDFVQRIIGLESGAVDAMTADEKFGGAVVAGDDRSLIIAADIDQDHLDTKPGIFRIAPDGSGKAALHDELLLSKWIFNIASSRGTWGFERSTALAEPHQVYAYTVAGGVRNIGCANGNDTTAHAIAVGQNAVFLSIYRGSMSTILRFPL